MTADYLRSTAADMRRVAEAATPGRWSTTKRGLTHPTGSEVESNIGEYVTSECCGYQGSTRDEDAEHIAHADPVFVLAGAVLLGRVAGVLDWAGENDLPGAAYDELADLHTHAVAVADAWNKGGVR